MIKTISISDENKKFAEELKEANLLGFNGLDNKDIFLFMVALGINEPTAEANYKGVSGGWFRTETLENDDESNHLYYLLTMGVANEEEIEKYVDLETNYIKAQYYADAGFKMLKQIYNEERGNIEAIERRLLSILEIRKQ